MTSGERGEKVLEGVLQTQAGTAIGRRRVSNHRPPEQVRVRPAGQTQEDKRLQPGMLSLTIFFYCLYYFMALSKCH